MTCNSKIILPAGCLEKEVVQLQCKGPDEAVYYQFSLANRIDDQTILEVSSQSSDDGVEISNIELDGQTFKCLISGGTIYHNIGIRFIAKTSNGETRNFNVVLPIRPEGVMEVPNSNTVIVMGNTGGAGKQSSADLNVKTITSDNGKIRSDGEGNLEVYSLRFADRDNSFYIFSNISWNEYKLLTNVNNIKFEGQERLEIDSRLEVNDALRVSGAIDSRALRVDGDIESRNLIVNDTIQVKKLIVHDELKVETFIGNKIYSDNGQIQSDGKGYLTVEGYIETLGIISVDRQKLHSHDFKRSQQAWDGNTNKLCWWDGSKWIDAMGNKLDS